MITKKIIVLAVVLIFSLAFWFFAKIWVSEPTFGLTLWLEWAIPLVLLIILTCFSALGLMFIEPFKFKLAVPGVIGLSFLVMFGFVPVYLAGLAVLILGHAYAAKLMREEMNGHTALNPKSAARGALTYVVLPLLVLLSIVYSQNPAIQENARKKQLPTAVTKSIEEVGNFVIAAQTQDLTPAQQAQVKKEFLKQLFGQINDWVRPYLKYFEYLPTVVGIGMFLVLWGFSFIYTPLTLLSLGWLFAGLKRAGFIQFTEHDTKIQRVVPL